MEDKQNKRQFMMEIINDQSMKLLRILYTTQGADTQTAEMLENEIETLG